MSTELTRRSVVVGALAVAAGGGAFWLRARRRSERALEAILELAREAELVSTGERFGRSYLDQHPAEADERTLLRLLAGDGAADGSLGARLAERIARDWIELDTVQLEGWIVARSEGRLLALVALQPPGAL